MTKSADAFRTISEVAEALDIPKHVLRFWEVKFPQIKPMKRGGGRRYYRPEDVVLLRGIRNLLHAEGYTIKGVQKILREQGVDGVKLFSAETKTKSGKTKLPATAEGLGRVRKLSRGTVARSAEADTRLIAELVSAAVRELEACRARLWQASGSPPAMATSQNVEPNAGARKTARAR